VHFIQAIHLFYRVHNFLPKQPIQRANARTFYQKKQANNQKKEGKNQKNEQKMQKKKITITLIKRI
jgi:hypothetical protein